MLRVLTPAASIDLVDLATVKAELGIAGSDEDARLARWIRQATARLARVCGRETWGRETVAETFDLPANRLVLARRPVTAIAAVTEGGVALADTDWRLDGRFLDRLVSGRPGVWAAVPVAVTYTAGYDLPAGAPDDLAEACLILLRYRWHGRDRDPALRSESVEGIGAESYAGAGGGDVLPADVAALVADYRWA